MTQPATGSPQQTTNFVDSSDALSPTYLNAPNFSAYRLAMMILFDSLSDGASIAVRARFPSLAPPDAFPYLGQDRTIYQGFREPIGSYVLRLQQWLDLLSWEGQPAGMLAALLGYVLPSTWTPTTPGTSPLIRTVDNSSNWYTYASGANPVPLAPPTTRQNAPANYPAGYSMLAAPTYLNASHNWRWDSLDFPYGYTTRWWRLWPILYSVSGDPWAVPTATYVPGGPVVVSVVSDANYGTVYSGSGDSGSLSTDFHWDDGTCWDWAGTATESSSLTGLAVQWKAANVQVVNVIVCYDNTYFDPSLSFGSAKLPDGHWGTWAKVITDVDYGTTYTPSRLDPTIATFLDGSPILNMGPSY